MIFPFENLKMDEIAPENYNVAPNKTSDHDKNDKINSP